MPNIYESFPSRYLKAHDLKGKTPTVTIDRVVFEQVRGKVTTDTKAVVRFRGHTKGLLLNVTNARTITQIARSAVTEDWSGVAIVLFATTATFGTETHDVVRIKAPTSAPTVRPPVKAAPAIRNPQSATGDVALVPIVPNNPAITRADIPF